VSFYHLYNRGVAKLPIYRCSSDYRRFLQKYEEYSKALGIDTVSYALLPNHFHFLLGCLSKEPNLEGLLRRLSTGHAMYFNRKYDRVGHLFQNRYRVKRVTTEFYLLHLSRYIHQNPLKLARGNKALAEQWKFIVKYPWSSYHAYWRTAKIRLGDTISMNSVPEIIFDNNNVCLKTGVIARLFGREHQLEQYIRFVQTQMLSCEKKAIKKVLFRYEFGSDSKK